MAKCEHCKKEMGVASTKSCTHKYIRLKGDWYKRDTDYYDQNERCHDCGILNKKGNVHHFSCDIERCPACGWQLLSCDCRAHYVELSKTLPISA